MNPAKKARLEDQLKSELRVEELEEAENHGMGELQKVEEVEVEGEIPSRSVVLETNSFPHILGGILAYLDPDSVKSASLVSR